MSKGSDSVTTSTRTFMKPPPPAAPSPKKSRLSINKTTLPWLIVGILVVVSLFLFSQYRVAQHKLQSSGVPVANKQVDDTIAKVRKLMILPANEKPTVATVQHADKLKDQSFFASAKNGDKVIVYSHQKLAILYRPSVNQIVTVAPVSVTQNPNAAPDIPTR